MSNTPSGQQPDLILPSTRPERPGATVVRTAYGTLLAVCLISVGKCALDFRNLSVAADPSGVTNIEQTRAGDEAEPEEPVLNDATTRRIAEILNPTPPDQKVLTIDEAHHAAGDETDHLPAPDNVSADPAPQTKPVQPEQPADIIPIRQQTPLHSQMVTPGNFVYLGAFRPPHVRDSESNFNYGGWAMAYRASGNSGNGSNEFPGSLFFLGHDQQQLVAELSIPKPRITKLEVLDELPVARILQPLSDVTGGLRQQMTGTATEPFMIGGMQVVENRLHWTLYKYYNVGGGEFYTHGSSTLDLSHPRPDGMWRLGPGNSGVSAWHSYKHAGYIFEIPQQAARQWFGGRNLISGLQVATGLSVASNGPAMFAYRLPPAGTPHGAALKADALMYYDVSRPVKDFNPADRWSGGAWLTVGGKQTVIIAGRKSLGPSYYGEARPQDCTPDKGYHGTPYEAQMQFYVPQILAAAARRNVDPQALVPWYIWNNQTPGGGFSQYLFPTCQQHIGSVAYDRDRNMLYISQVNAGTTTDAPYDNLPAIHVFKLKE